MKRLWPGCAGLRAIHPTSGGCATTDAVRGRKTLDQVAQSGDLNVGTQATWGMSVGEVTMKLLVHITSGPEQPNKITLGCLVALTAHNESHHVQVALAADGVHLLAPGHADIEGQGTGRLGDHIAALKEAGVEFFVSGKSAKARGYDDSLLDGVTGGFGMPDKLIAMVAEANKVLCY